MNGGRAAPEGGPSVAGTVERIRDEISQALYGFTSEAAWAVVGDLFDLVLTDIA
jgi:hypothetical protein